MLSFQDCCLCGDCFFPGLTPPGCVVSPFQGYEFIGVRNPIIADQYPVKVNMLCGWFRISCVATFAAGRFSTVPALQNPRIHMYNKLLLIVIFSMTKY